MKHLAITWTDEALTRIVHRYTKESGVRAFEREIATVCRKIAKDWLAAGKPEGATFEVSPDALGGALGPDLMATLGGLLGGNGAQASSVLAQVLPGLVDQLTPQGRVPEAGAGGIDPRSLTEVYVSINEKSCLPPASCSYG